MWIPISGKMESAEELETLAAVAKINPFATDRPEGSLDCLA